MLQNKNRSNIDAIQLQLNLDSVKVILSVFLTFILTCLAWIFFRAKTIAIAFDYINKMFTNAVFETQYLANRRYNYEILILILLFVWVEWNNRTKQEPISGRFSTLRLALCIITILALGTYSDFKEFIYFQF